MHVVVVLHGGAGKYALDHDACAARCGGGNVHPDPDGGVAPGRRRTLPCGQTAVHRGFPRDRIASTVRVALSAMTVLTTLQMQGYAVVAF